MFNEEMMPYLYQKKRSSTIFLCVFVFALCVFKNANGNNKMKTVPSIYEKISEFEPFGPSECSPNTFWPPRDEDKDKRGIWISGPEKIIANGDYRLPLCGKWTFNTNYLDGFRNILLDMTMVVVDRQSHQSYSDNFSDKKFGLDYIDERGDGTSNDVISGFFNVDIYEYIPSLPKKTGYYMIYVILGDKKSNVIEVKIVDNE